MYEAVLVTTTDNKFNPFDDFANWNRMDQDLGYNTWSLLLRIAKLSHEMTQRESDDELSAASKEVAFYNTTGKYKLVRRMISDDAEN